MFYAENFFYSYGSCNGLRAVYRWVDALGEERAGKIQNLFLQWPWMRSGSKWRDEDRVTSYIRAMAREWNTFRPRIFVRICQGQEQVDGFQMSFGSKPESVRPFSLTSA